MDSEKDRSVQADARDDRADLREERVDAREIRVDDTERKIFVGVRWLLWLSVVLAVLMIGNFARTWILQDHVDTLNDAVTRTEEAANITTEVALAAQLSADSALLELREAIKAVQESNQGEPSLNNQAIIDALEAITRIESRLCGGTCPEP